MKLAEAFLKLQNIFLAALFLLLVLSPYSHDSSNVRLEYAVQCVGPGESGKAGAQGQLTAIRTPMFKNTQGIRVRVKRGYELGQWDSYDTDINTKQSSLVPFKMALKEARPLASSFLPSVPWSEQTWYREDDKDGW